MERHDITMHPDNLRVLREDPERAVRGFVDDKAGGVSASSGSRAQTPAVGADETEDDDKKEETKRGGRAGGGAITRKKRARIDDEGPRPGSEGIEEGGWLSGGGGEEKKETTQMEYDPDLPLPPYTAEQVAWPADML